MISDRRRSNTDRTQMNQHSRLPCIGVLFHRDTHPPSHTAPPPPQRIATPNTRAYSIEPNILPSGLPIFKSGSLDEMEMLTRRRKKRKQLHMLQNRGKILLDTGGSGSGAAHIKIPQGARIAIEQQHVRRYYTSLFTLLLLLSFFFFFLFYNHLHPASDASNLSLFSLTSFLCFFLFFFFLFYNHLPPMHLHFLCCCCCWSNLIIIF